LILILTTCIATATPSDLPVPSSQISASEPIPFQEERTIKPHPAAPFANPASAENAPLHTQAENDLIITKVGHFGGATYAAEPSGNYAYVGQRGDFVVLDITNKSAPVEVDRIDTSGVIWEIRGDATFARKS